MDSCGPCAFVYAEVAPDGVGERIRRLPGDYAELVAGAEVEGIARWPERAERTMRWLAAHTLHEGIHHLADIGDVVRRLRTADH